MRLASEVPDEARTFQTPVVPHLVVAQVGIFVERQVARIESAVLVQAGNHFVLIALAIRFDQKLQHALHGFLLIVGQVADLDAGELAFGALETVFLFDGALLHQGNLLLLAVEDLVHLVGGLGLMPEDIARVVCLFVERLGGVAVEDRSTERDVLGRVAIAAHRHVTTGHHQLELALAWLAEDGDILLLAEATGIVLKLLVKLLDPVRIHHADKDLPDQVLLVLGVVVAGDRLIDDVPVVFDVRS
mmetsp:Transcript_74425/g.151124  ORF Transcript_74425/g.151124 Transcript_74425/m.151124 type:complete len:245 (+) Transcript_74425:206-940(+)